MSSIFSRAITVAVAGALGLGISHGGDASWAAPSEDRDVAVRAYSGLGSWVDLYNKGVWKRPVWVVDRMAEQGVQSIFLETSSYKFRKAIVHPNAVGRYLDRAREHGMTVVAWYVPSFKPVKRDLRRAAAALGFVSPGGHTFDSFALDIEATVVGDVDERNERTVRLARGIRRLAGDDYPLGAIVPDPVGSLYWTDFPYESVGSVFDVFLPMSYFTFRVDGARAVRRYVRANVRAVRERTGRADAPVHPIGGLARPATLAEVRAYVRATFAERALGGSLYDFPIMRASQWEPLRRLTSKRVPAPEPSPLLFGHRHLL